MPKGFHCGRTQTRAYTSEYTRIHANVFKILLTKPLGNYTLNSEHLSDEHKKIKLLENKNGIRYVAFTISDKPHHIALKLDNSSASNKLYITCPYCRKQRQHLYAIKNAYACRQCIGLHYASQSERPMERLGRRIRKLRGVLWGSDWPDRDNLLESCEWWPKPKYMNSNKYRKERTKISLLEKKYTVLCAAQLESWFGEEYSHLM
jgi:hypothetical protein